MRLIIRILINIAGLWLAIQIVPGITAADDSFLMLLVTALVFGLVNAFIRPIVSILAFPITLLTLGLFTFVINALMLMLTAWVTPLTLQGNFFQSFMAALFGSVIISIVSSIANWLLPDQS